MVLVPACSTVSASFVDNARQEQAFNIKILADTA